MKPSQKLWRALLPPLIYTLVALGLVCSAVLFVGRDMERKHHGHHTEYCPPSHQRGEFRACSVLDKTGDRVLIQHAELDGSHCYLEIRSPSLSNYYAMPDSIVRFAPQGYTAKLIEGSTSEIKFNGGAITLKPIDGPTF